MEKYDFGKIKEAIEKAKKVLIVSHSSPDYDAVASSVFTHNVLKENFPSKEVFVNIEAASFTGYKMIFDTSFITSELFEDVVKKTNPDLLMILDLSASALISRKGERTSDIINSITTIYIDHHPDLVAEDVLAVINERDSSCAETAYKVFAHGLGLKMYNGFADHVLMGIVGDTSFFRYLEKSGRDTFPVVSELVEAGGNIDRVAINIGRLNENEVKIHTEMLTNLKSNGEYSYTFVSDSFFAKYPHITDAEYSNANKIFVQYYLKSIGDALWGFTFKPLRSGGYTISFRCEQGMLDLTVFASKFNGGGHKSSAGGFVDAKSDSEALERIIEVVEKYKEEALTKK